ncbi:helix-turn-helix domain-containing protein [Streptomyces sp. NBC_01433]|uniref:helix-turn-helix domain-containing protein n=1 Tax=Streptomyces sp. NBC_01433 TaxID=2903864 RepID=UPI00225C3AE4|nr:helix-turn-helix domain-containing protein [Streptomyces sp. NBC_01433]MCX4682197.1 helix-turn-helix domain-containing protein [Streptomyces sp. NBC_01433]
MSSTFNWPKPGTRTSGEARARGINEYRTLYSGHVSIRTLAKMSGRSYGYVHACLVEGGVKLSPQGGNHRSPLRQTDPGTP